MKELPQNWREIISNVVEKSLEEKKLQPEETPAPAQKEAANERIIETTKDMSEYYNDCHKYVYHVFATQWILKKGLYYEINKLQIGYDIEEKAIIIPIDKNHYEKYSIKE